MLTRNNTVHVDIDGRFYIYLYYYEFLQDLVLSPEKSILVGSRTRLGIRENVGSLVPRSLFWV
jgi:hypothetical protein